ncbi:tRNA (cytosine(72)-C(5))-methyltransferase NSUN6 [Amyelois transitella]|uniref:tRNA (cytosine(72)-C(5))-methyltransferase NSUN6 n=1 Tax=Amyelois transitella TaxID=680683 RepID=UPI00298FEC8B|nr:tRNA (cytosine(72)-C(5))-methyltransferase NSUN6 [Amyelois transitella]XP_060803220.1 tRNA (cytosine(72)-C(5))-methyltransferase NSUN6 [Amyelois transitella]
MHKIQDWLARPPKYTTFRINSLRKFEYDKLTNYLIEQSKELNTTSIPKFYLLRPDCLVVEQWTDDVKIENGNKIVVVDALCAAAVLRGAHVFAPGVMGLPSGKIIFKFLLKVNYDGKKKYVGTGYLKMTRNELFDNGIQASGIAVHTLLPASRLPVINETLYPKGTILLQNLPSIVCGWVVDAKPHEVILDMCAAPGNKTTHLAEMSHDQANIIALDKTPQKIASLQKNCYSHGLTCIKAFVFDSTKCCSYESDGVHQGPPYPPNSFDKVLLDAPCSGLGQRPQLINKMTPKMLQSYKFVQRKLFRSAVEVLKFGGRLTYSTCTVTEDENERIVSWALETFPCLSLVPAEPLLGGPGLPNCGLSDQQREMVQRFSPTDDSLRFVDPIYKDTIGFFIAQFTKLK